jgi:hypothetical protein
MIDPTALRGFTGSTEWYRHGLVRTITYTEGAKYVADAGGAYWLLDEIALAQRAGNRVNAEAFQAWTLKVDRATSSAVLSCSDGGKAGRGEKIVMEKKIDFTDFPLDEITLWFCDNVILLPSEY